MHRYLSSFLISSLIYLSAFGSIFYLVSNNDNPACKIQNQTPKSVHFSIIEPSKIEAVKEKPKEAIVKKEIKPKPKKKPKKKVKPKPIKKPILKKKIIKPKESISKELITEVVPKEIVEEVENVAESQSTQKVAENTKTISREQQQIDQDIKANKKREFLERLVKEIHKHKTYPNMARRRCIEGVVDIKFTILSDGRVDAIEIISGKSIFKKATLQAIEKCFPIKVDSTLFDFPEVFKIKIEYILKS